MTSFVRSYIEHGQFFRKNVYKVEQKGRLVKLTPMFGKFKDSFTIPNDDYVKHVLEDNLIAVQPMRSIINNDLYFMHNTLHSPYCINWTNGILSGVMSNDTISLYQITEL
nr:MAG TPA: hypothetical protein [Bacteriophage sp.]